MDIQEIVERRVDERRAVMVITKIAAGFILGRSGSTLRDVCKHSHVDIKSNAKDDVRVFTITSEDMNKVRAAVKTIEQAVDKYKELAEGDYSGMHVARYHKIRGVTFEYAPPPRAAMPHAAKLKKHPKQQLTTTQPQLTQQQLTTQQQYELFPAVPVMHDRVGPALLRRALFSM